MVTRVSDASAEAEMSIAATRLDSDAARGRRPTGALIDVRFLAPAFRHALIFSAVESLNGGGSFCIVNDHDPRPVFHLFSAQYPGIFEWTYERRGPDVWWVRIDRLVA
jgi:uncharacterized protein (DUF2249 family)